MCYPLRKSSGAEADADGAIAGDVGARFGDGRPKIATTRSKKGKQQQQPQRQQIALIGDSLVPYHV